jgi:hypothetical protein
MAKKADPIGDAFATATVLAWRLPMLCAMALNPTPRRRTEALRMISEKTAAAAEAVIGAQAELVLSLLRPKQGAVTDKIAEAMLKPARRRLKANARRVRRKRRV